MTKPKFGGVGVIFTLHHVRPGPVYKFDVNQGLEIKPEFLDSTIRMLKKQGYDLISLDEAVERLRSPKTNKRFVCFTLDDAYKDNLKYAFPIFKKHSVPFTLYVPTSFCDRKGVIWWAALEKIILKQDRISFLRDGVIEYLDCSDHIEERKSFDILYWWLRGMKPDKQIEFIKDLSSRYGVDLIELCDSLVMNWKEIAELAADPLVTIGSHTVNHYRLAGLSEEAAMSEIKTGNDILASYTDVAPKHFCYPYGDETAANNREFELVKNCGLSSAVTTRKGMLFEEHQHHLTALPRISLNGQYQRLHYVSAFMSGLPFYLVNNFNHMNLS